MNYQFSLLSYIAFIFLPYFFILRMDLFDYFNRTHHIDIEKRYAALKRLGFLFMAFYAREKRYFFADEAMMKERLSDAGGEIVGIVFSVSLMVFGVAMMLYDLFWITSLADVLVSLVLWIATLFTFFRIYTFWEFLKNFYTL